MTRAGTGYVLLAAADTALAYSGRKRARLATKPLLMPTLAAGLMADREDRAVRRTLAAQALSWGGDVALMAPGRRPFLAGLGSFLAAHLAYVAAFRSRSSDAVLGTPKSRATMALGTVVAAGMGIAAGRRDPRLAGPVAAYGMVLATMVATSMAVPPGPGRSRIVTGTSLFLLSDTLLGVRKFLLSEQSAALDAAVMGTYTAAQWCISDGMARSA